MLPPYSVLGRLVFDYFEFTWVEEHLSKVAVDIELDRDEELVFGVGWTDGSDLVEKARGCA